MPKPHTTEKFDEAIKDAEDALDINKLFYNECLSLYSDGLTVVLDKIIKKSNDMTITENQRKAYKKIPAFSKLLSEVQEKIGNLHANLEAKCKQAMNQRKESRQLYLNMLSVCESEEADKAEKQISDEPNLKEIVIQIWTKCWNEIEASKANHSETEITTE